MFIHRQSESELPHLNKIAIQVVDSETLFVNSLAFMRHCRCTPCTEGLPGPTMADCSGFTICNSVEPVSLFCCENKSMNATNALGPI